MIPAKQNRASWLHIIIFCSLLLTMSGCSADDPTRPNTFVPLTAIEVISTYETMAAGTENQYRAIGDFSGAFTRDITEEVAWRVENKKIAEVSTKTGSEGLVTALLAGETSVIAIYGDITGSEPVVVTNAFLTGIVVAPQDLELQTGVTRQYEAFGTFSDDSVQDITGLAAWVSSDTQIATVDNSGLAATVDPGTAIISATWQGIEASASLLVTAAQLTSITITPEQPGIAKGTTLQFAAEGTFSDDTTLDITDIVEWGSEDSGIGMINTAGLATGVAAGTTDITASYEVDGETISSTVELTVTNAFIESILITPANATIQQEEDQQFEATGIFSDDSEQNITDLATWSISNNSVGTISNSSDSRGLFIPIEIGFTLIEATFDEVTGETGLTVE